MGESHKRLVQKKTSRTCLKINKAEKIAKMIIIKYGLEWSSLCGGADDDDDGLTTGRHKVNAHTILKCV